MSAFILWFIFYIALTIIICLVTDETDVYKKYNKLYDEYNKYIKNDKYK